jgi:cytochrome c biogenesis protein CcmG, thiol:disulfide interchange protein DsbE
MLRRISLLVVLLGACAAPTPRRAPPRARVSFEALELENLDGARVQFTAERKQRPMLIALWATWCDTCATEFAALARLAPKAAEQGAYVVAISEGETRDTVTAFVRARDLRYPQLIDEHFLVADAIGARNLPTTLVLDRSGVVVYRGAALDKNALLALDRVIAAQ